MVAQMIRPWEYRIKNVAIITFLCLSGMGIAHFALGYPRQTFDSRIVVSSLVVWVILCIRAMRTGVRRVGEGLVVRGILRTRHLFAAKGWRFSVMDARPLYQILYLGQGEAIPSLVASRPGDSRGSTMLVFRNICSPIEAEVVAWAEQCNAWLEPSTQSGDRGSCGRQP